MTSFRTVRFYLKPTWCCAVQQSLTITSFALSLLLVFRTNTSYGRFAEARSIWGMVLNRSRDLTRQAASFFPTATWDAKATFTRWTMCFSKCLLIHLRPHLSLRDEVAEVLGREELQILLAAEHPVVMCIQVRQPLPGLPHFYCHAAFPVYAILQVKLTPPGGRAYLHFSRPVVIYVIY